MNRFTSRSHHAVYLYALGVGLMALTFIGGFLWNKTSQNTWIRMLCDGFSTCAAFFFLASYFYRPKKFGFREVMRYGIACIFWGGYEVKTKRDAELEKAVQTDFLDALLLFAISAAGVLISFFLYCCIPL